MNRRAAIEFSANVIVIIVISSVILGLGLMLFFNLKSQATKYTDSIEEQTAEQLKALMLNDNSKIAVYPNDLTIQRGKSQMTTVAVMNNLETTNLFQTPNIPYLLVEYFETPNTIPIRVNNTANPSIGWNSSAAIIVSKTGGFGTSQLNLGYINPGEQGFKNILIKIPKAAKKGQYVITINITNTAAPPCVGGCPTYGLTKLYITVP